MQTPVVQRCHSFPAGSHVSSFWMFSPKFLTTQLHYLVCRCPFAAFICCLIFPWCPLGDVNRGWCFLFCFDRQLYCFASLGLIAQLTAWFLCTSSSLKPDTQRLILTHDKWLHAVLPRCVLVFQTHSKCTEVYLSARVSRSSAGLIDWLNSQGGLRTIAVHVHK